MTGIDLKTRYLAGFLLLGLFVPACSTRAPRDDIVGAEPQQIVEAHPITPSATETKNPTTDSSSEPVICQEAFEDRELREPYQRYEGQPRYTLSDEELSGYLDLMGIESICLPVQFGAPFINVDWNSLYIPATGRMVSIGFEELYRGGGWTTGYLLFSTYDFSIGSEYDVFASLADFEQVRDHSAPNPINIDGVEGFIRYHPGIPMGMQVISQTYIFPFEDHYIAVVLALGAFDPSDIEDVLRELEEGSHPDLLDKNVYLIEGLVSSIKFK